MNASEANRIILYGIHCDYRPKRKIKDNAGACVVGNITLNEPGGRQPKIGAPLTICATSTCTLSNYGICSGGRVQKNGNKYELERDDLGEEYAGSGFCRMRGGTSVFVASE